MKIKRVYPTKPQKALLKLLRRGTVVRLSQSLVKGAGQTYTESSGGETVNSRLAKAMIANGWMDSEGKITASGIAVIDDGNHMFHHPKLHVKGAKAGGRG